MPREDRSSAPPAFDANDVKRMFSEDAKKALQEAGADAILTVTEEGKKQAWVTQRKREISMTAGTTGIMLILDTAGTMANGQNFVQELLKSIAEAEAKGAS